MDDASTICPTDWDEILALLPLLESGQSLYSLHDISSFDPYHYGPELSRWRSYLEQSAFSLRFDWPQWIDQAQALDQNPSLVAEADLLTLRKLLTCYLRTERFTSGTLAHLVDSGKLLQILQRLAKLRRAPLEASPFSGKSGAADRA